MILTKEQLWELVISLAGALYLIASLIRGLQSPAFGLLIVGMGAMKVMVSSWIHHGS